MEDDDAAANGLTGLKPFAPAVAVNGKQPALPAEKKTHRSCAGCSSSAKEGNDRVCRGDMPRVFMFLMPVAPPAHLVKPGQQGIPSYQFVTQTCFPVVRDDGWCKKFEPRT